MKTTKFYFCILVVCSFLFTSCSKDEAILDGPSDEVAELSFGSVLNSMANKTTAKQADELPDCLDGVPAYALIELTYGDANTPVNVSVPIMYDGDSYFTAYSEDLAIPVPAEEDWVTVNLTSFEIFTSNNTLIWKAPYEGSQFEDFVEDALPMSFELRAGSKNYKDVEVLCFDDRVVNKYGYQFFDIIPEELRTLCFFANYCTDEGRHFTADYELDLFYYTGDATGDIEETPAPADLDILYSDRSPVQFETSGGVFYTDPLCVAIPERQMGEANDEPYLYYQVTLVEWSENYTLPEDAVVQTGFLSWNDIVRLLDTDGDSDIEDNSDANYWHVQLNCGSDDGPPPVEDDDIDNDDIPDDIDQCDDTPAGVEVYETGDRIGCTIEDGGNGDDCPPALEENCVQVDYDGQDLNLPPPGSESEIPAIPLLVEAGGTNYGEAQFDVQVDDDGTFDLVVTFNMAEGYAITATQLTLTNYLNNSQVEEERTVCLKDFTEDTYVLTIENLEGSEITDFYPLTFDLVANICSTE